MRHRGRTYRGGKRSFGQVPSAVSDSCSGGIYAFDPDSDLKIKSSAIGRMSFGVIASLILSALWRWPLEAVALASLIGAVLGYVGMMWAKFADF